MDIQQALVKPNTTIEEIVNEDGSITRTTTTVEIISAEKVLKENKDIQAEIDSLSEKLQ